MYGKDFKKNKHTHKKTQKNNLSKNALCSNICARYEHVSLNKTDVWTCMAKISKKEKKSTFFSKKIFRFFFGVITCAHIVNMCRQLCRTIYFFEYSLSCGYSGTKIFEKLI